MLDNVSGLFQNITEIGLYTEAHVIRDEGQALLHVLCIPVTITQLLSSLQFPVQYKLHTTSPMEKKKSLACS